MFEEFQDEKLINDYFEMGEVIEDMLANIAKMKKLMGYDDKHEVVLELMSRVGEFDTFRDLLEEELNKRGFWLNSDGTAFIKGKGKVQ
jgi:hypothetical protein